MAKHKIYVASSWRNELFCNYSMLYWLQSNIVCFDDAS